MIVVHLANCPTQLRGDLSKWLSEINTGVYVGILNAKVREELWERICSNLKNGQATMVYSTNNEQGFDYKVHNTSWEPVDYEGIKLMRRPAFDLKRDLNKSILKDGFSNASKYNKIKMNASKKVLDSYIIIDIETSGLDYKKDRIIEIGILKITEGKIYDRWQTLIKQKISITDKITQITGITKELIDKEGVDEVYALKKLMDVIGNNTVVGYNVSFDLNFIQVACNELSVANIIKHSVDILNIARRKIDFINNYKMQTVAQYFSIDATEVHRALPDCELEYRILQELNEL